MPAVAAGFVLLVVIGAELASGGDSDAGSDEFVASGTLVDATIPAPTVAPITSVAVSPVESTVPKTTLAQPLVLGSTGEDVRRLQQRLTDLGFQPGPIDGAFGSGTQQAVWAYKKLVGNIAWEVFAERNDQTTVTNELWQEMQDPSVAIMPRRPGAGTHTEVYLPIQVVAVFTDNEPVFVAHVSSGELNPDGTPATFCEEATYDTDEYGVPYEEPVTKQVCAEAKSPGGVFRYNRSYDGQRISPLGGMKNPWYFNYGIAIHGAHNVPDFPASHGCIRISNSLADVLPGFLARGQVVYVWGHDGKEPEQYTERERLPSFNRPDPNATTTTSTTVPPSTTTTVPATTTTVRPTTTTTSTTTTTTTTTPLTGGGEGGGD